MANYYTLFSEIIPCEDEEETNWLMRELGVAVKDEGGDHYPACNYAEDQGGVWVYEEEAADLDALLDVVCRFQLEFGKEEPWTITWAHTCSEPRLSSFSGGGAVAYKGKSEWLGAGTWCAIKAKELQAKDADGAEDARPRIVPQRDEQGTLGTFGVPI